VQLRIISAIAQLSFLILGRCQICLHYIVCLSTAHIAKWDDNCVAVDMTLTANVTDEGDTITDHPQRGTDVMTVSAAAEQRLIGHLLRHYDVDARGVLSVQSTVPVAVQLLLLRMQQLVRLFSLPEFLTFLYFICYFTLYLVLNSFIFIYIYVVLTLVRLSFVFTARCYAERGYAAVSRLSVCLWRWGMIFTQVGIRRKQFHGRIV